MKCKPLCLSVDVGWRTKGCRTTPECSGKRAARCPSHSARGGARARHAASEDCAAQESFVFPSVRLALSRATRSAPERFRILQFSVQRDHVHIIVEAIDKRALSSGVRGLAIRIARYVNDLLGRRGTFWADRWHGRALRSPREVRNALVYVLANFRKHVPRERRVGRQSRGCRRARVPAPRSACRGYVRAAARAMSGRSSARAAMRAGVGSAAGFSASSKRSAGVTPLPRQAKSANAAEPSTS